MVDFNYFLNRKYALLAQNADADTSRANSTAISAVAGANASNAAADATRVNTTLAPAESASRIGLQGAQTRFTDEQTRFFGPTAQANIANTNAQTGFIGTQNRALTYNELTNPVTGRPVDAPGGSGGSGLSFGGVGLPGNVRFSTLPAETPRRRGETEASYLNRINGL